MEELFSDKNWGMAPLVFDDMRVLFHAGGQLIEIVDKFGNPFLKALPAGVIRRFLQHLHCFLHNMQDNIFSVLLHIFLSEALK
jgi:hypothetical protein